ncbi:MAG: dihydrodipicolinate synthase family protein [Microbacteriaceae bacterium]|nr:MAG: dihydrodipicolinate synthase family protein [Microbacteriaceae bacterium]
MFAGLSAFPLTPITGTGIDESAFARLVRRLADAGVDSVGALGSTGSYAYLNRAERARAAAIAVENAGNVPVIIGVGSVRTRHVLAHIDDAQNVGASGVLLPAMSYQQLTDDEVFDLYADASEFASVPIVVYDNPSTTHIDFSDELHGRIAALDGVVSIKIPPVPLDAIQAKARVDRLRALIPPNVSIGVSGDEAGASGLLAGCETWYSAIAGILPDQCLAIARAAAADDAEQARALSDRMRPVWMLLRHYGSYRVASAIAEYLGLATGPSLPRPVQGLDSTGRRAVVMALAEVGVTV